MTKLIAAFRNFAKEFNKCVPQTPPKDLAVFIQLFADKRLQAWEQLNQLQSPGSEIFFYKSTEQFKEKKR